MDIRKEGKEGGRKEGSNKRREGRQHKSQMQTIDGIDITELNEGNH